MPSANSDRRRAPRHPLQAASILHPLNDSSGLPATTVNVSSSGVLLNHGTEISSHPGDDVACELQLPPSADPDLPCWGIGRIVRVEGSQSAVQFDAGLYGPANDEPQHG